MNLVPDNAYPGALPMQPAQGTEPTEPEVAQQLAIYLKTELPQNRAQIRALFTSAEVKARILSPSLRAALAALTGTIAEPALDLFLNEKTARGLPVLAQIHFGQSTLGAGELAEVFMSPDTEQATVLVSDRFRAESFPLFTNWIAHEMLHIHSVANRVAPSNMEEAVVYALHPLVYAQQLLRHPDLARLGTELARVSNGWLLLRLQSGQGKTMGLYDSNQDRPILPGSTSTITNWWAAFQSLPNLSSTPGSALLSSYLTKLGVVAPNANLSKATLDLISAAGNGPFRTQDLIQIAEALKLDVGCPAQ